jgi:hypothetical protein
MRLFRKLLGMSLLAASIAFVRGRRRALRVARGAEERFDNVVGTSVPSNEDLVEVATSSGIADVDPEPLSHVAGEGIDPIRDVEAHDSIKAVRERMPR